jgi:riboflavin biosynthesis pyrimidine reductase
MVGAGTVVADDPLLTVRMVPGATPIRVVLASTLRVPPDSQSFGPDAATIVLTSQRSDPDRREALRLRGVKVEVVGQAPDGIDLAGGLARLRSLGIRCLLVEGGSASSRRPSVSSWRAGWWWPWPRSCSAKVRMPSGTWEPAWCEMGCAC